MTRLIIKYLYPVYLNEQVLGQRFCPGFSHTSLGPIGYSIYTLPVGEIACHYDINYHLYADDIQLYVSFDPKTPGALNNALTKLQTCISNIRKWMVANKLTLNDSKTEFFVAASAHNLRNLPNVQLNVGSTIISPSETIRNLNLVLSLIIACQCLTIFLTSVVL